MPWKRNTDNISPGKQRGIKARKIKGRLLPANLDFNSTTFSWWHRDTEIVPGARRSDYKPFRSKPIKRRERRGQAKPRG